MNGRTNSHDINYAGLDRNMINVVLVVVHNIPVCIKNIIISREKIDKKDYFRPENHCT